MTSLADPRAIVGRLAALALLAHPRETRAALHARLAPELQRPTLDALEAIRRDEPPPVALREAAAPLLELFGRVRPGEPAVALAGLAAFGRVAPDPWLDLAAGSAELALRDSAEWLPHAIATALLRHCGLPEPSSTESA